MKEEPEEEEEDDEEDRVIKKNGNTSQSRAERLAHRQGVKVEDIVKTSASPITKTSKPKTVAVKEEKTPSRTSTRKV